MFGRVLREGGLEVGPRRIADVYRFLFRAFDVVKPPPIRQLEMRFKGGFGVMFDDILAAGYTLLVLALCKRLFF